MMALRHAPSRRAPPLTMHHSGRQRAWARQTREEALGRSPNSGTPEAGSTWRLAHWPRAATPVKPLPHPRTAQRPSALNERPKNPGEGLAWPPAIQTLPLCLCASRPPWRCCVRSLPTVPVPYLKSGILRLANCKPSQNARSHTRYQLHFGTSSPTTAPATFLYPFTLTLSAL